MKELLILSMIIHIYTIIMAFKFFNKTCRSDFHHSERAISAFVMLSSIIFLLVGSFQLWSNTPNDILITLWYLFDFVNSVALCTVVIHFYKCACGENNNGKIPGVDADNVWRGRRWDDKLSGQKRSSQEAL